MSLIYIKLHHHILKGYKTKTIFLTLCIKEITMADDTLGLILFYRQSLKSHQVLCTIHYISLTIFNRGNH
jgi:hypothetical protein